MSRVGRVGIFAGIAVVSAALTASPARSVPPATCIGQPATIVGTDGDDVLKGTTGPDVVSLGDGNDRFNDKGGDDIVCGGPGADYLWGSDGDDRLYGEAGADTIYGVLGDDLLDGGLDNDELWDDSVPFPLRGGDGADDLLGGDGNDQLHLSGGDGKGHGKADTADGGPGNDSLGYESSPVGVTIDVTAATSTGSAVDTFASIERSFTGSGLADTLIGTSGDDELHAGRAESGVDRVFAFAGHDVLTADSGIVRAGPGDDVFDNENETGSNLELFLGTGNDQATLWDGRENVVHGEEGHDDFVVNWPHDSSGLRAVLRGGPGTDRITFGLVPRRIHVDLASGQATFGKSLLRLRAIDEVVGSALPDTLVGGPADDILRGLGGDDVLRGRAGSDVLVGDEGNDVAYGGPGHDICDAETQHFC